MTFDLAVVDISDADFRNGIVQRKARHAAAFYAEALRMISAEMINYVCVQSI